MSDSPHTNDDLWRMVLDAHAECNKLIDTISETEGKIIGCDLIKLEHAAWRLSSAITELERRALKEAPARVE